MNIKELILNFFSPGKKLHENNILSSPFLQFDEWFTYAKKNPFTFLPEAMFLSTIDLNDYPDGRMVLLKGYDEKGFVFYTNYNSVKGQSILKNSRAQLTFYWMFIQRMIRIKGNVEPVSPIEADEYFNTRPKESRLGAWASLQSQVLDSREILEEKFKEFEDKYKDGVIPRPPHWSGFRVKPISFEFWQQREFRMHDRFLYSINENGSWNIKRLYP